MTPFSTKLKQLLFLAFDFLFLVSLAQIVNNWCPNVLGDEKYLAQ